MMSSCDLKFNMMIKKKNYAQKFYRLNMNECVRVTISAHFWHHKIALVSKIVSANVIGCWQMISRLYAYY